VKYGGSGVFTLQGVRMNGPSVGSSYGDDVESDENYPIVTRFVCEAPDPTTSASTESTSFEYLQFQRACEIIS
jgi:hypothetical protein